MGWEKMPLFKPKYTIVKVKKKEIPGGLWTKCEECAVPVYNKTLDENSKVCPKCGYHFTLTAKERINLLIDEPSFKEYDADLKLGSSKSKFILSLAVSVK